MIHTHDSVNNTKSNPFSNKNKKEATPFFSPVVIQPKLTIGPPNDSYEQEADAMAEKVMRMADKDVSPTPVPPVVIQKKCAHCEEEEKLQRKEETEEEDVVQRKCAACEEEDEIHRKASADTNVHTVSSSVYQTINSTGQSLDAVTRSFMESRFNYDFSNVQVHNDTSAHQSSKDINAKAYTHGSHIVFGSGHYQPHTYDGRQLLAHELTHVIQQGANKVSRKIQRAPISYRQITWADFLGPIPATIDKEGAAIKSGFDIQYPTFVLNTKDKKTKCKIGRKSSTQFEATKTMDYSGADKIQAYMDPDVSWALDRFKNPGPAYCNSQVATCQSQLSRSQTEAAQGCGAWVKQCEDAFNKEHKSSFGMNLGGRDIIAKNTYDCNNSFLTKCRELMSKGASITISGVPITSAGDCKTKYFPKCISDDKAENVRLLKHEQGHFDITNVIAGKARNDLKARANSANLTATGCGIKEASDAATALSDKLTTDLGAAGPAWQKLKNDLQTEYDTKTKNGSDTVVQSTWERDIKGGLTKYTIPPVTTTPATTAPPATTPAKPAPTPTQKPTPGFQRKCAACEEEEEMQRKESAPVKVPPVSASVYNAIGSTGLPLDHNTRTFMESRFDHDFSTVRIHDDALAHQSSADINAKAYTYGQHIVFASGAYQPETHSGKQLLAHELTHVIQQGGDSLKRKASREEEIKKTKARQEKCWSTCGGRELGSADCELGPDGLPTDKAVKTTQPMDSCIKPCVDRHEQIHLNDMRRICKDVHQCLKKAKGNDKKQDECLDEYEYKLFTVIPASECRAYKTEIKCLESAKTPKECKTDSGKKSLAEKLKNSKCYRDCYCLQPKLSINPPDDIYEREADAMAEKVMKAPVDQPLAGKPAGIQKKCAACEEQEKIQRKGVGVISTSMPPDIVARKSPPAPKVKIDKVNAPNTPRPVNRIIPNKELEVNVKVTGASDTDPVQLSIDGAGADNGTVKINSLDSYDIKSTEKITLKGIDQTQPKHSNKLSVIAKHGGTTLARSNTFSVAAYPAAVGFNFHSFLSGAKLRDINGLNWGAAYDTQVKCDSGEFADCNKTFISENVGAATHTGFFSSIALGSSDFLNSTARQIDHNAINEESAKKLKERIDKADIDKSALVVNQFFRFACERTGIKQDRKNGPKVPTSGFKLTQKVGKYFVTTKREGFANSGVEAGNVDNDKEIKSDVDE